MLPFHYLLQVVKLLKLPLLSSSLFFVNNGAVGVRSWNSGLCRVTVVKIYSDIKNIGIGQNVSFRCIPCKNTRARKELVQNSFFFSDFSRDTNLMFLLFATGDNVSRRGWSDWDPLPGAQQ